MLEIILVIVSILLTIKMLNEMAANPQDPEYQEEKQLSLIEIEQVEDSKKNPVYLVYYNGDFLMQDSNRENLEIKLGNWLKERGVRVLDPREAEKDFSGA
jgi:hypothetical protein